MSYLYLNLFSELSGILAYVSVWFLHLLCHFAGKLLSNWSVILLHWNYLWKKRAMRWDWCQELISILSLKRLISTMIDVLWWLNVWYFGAFICCYLWTLRSRHMNYILLTNFGFRRKHQFYLKSVTTTRKVDGEDLLIHCSPFFLFSLNS